ATYRWKPSKGASVYESTVRGNNGMIEAAARNSLFVFDPVKKEIVTTMPVDDPSGQAMRISLSDSLAADGLIYGIDTRNGRLLQVDPTNNEWKILGQHASLVGARVAKVKEDGHLYYATH